MEKSLMSKTINVYKATFREVVCANGVTYGFAVVTVFAESEDEAYQHALAMVTNNDMNAAIGTYSIELVISEVGEP